MPTTTRLMGSILFLVTALILTHYWRLWTLALPQSAVCHFSKHKVRNMLHVEIIPTLEDNYSYLVLDQTRKSALAVDPVEPSKVLAKLPDGFSLKAVLTTHHHSDHAAGNNEMRRRFPGLRVFGGDDRVEGMTDIPKDDFEIDDFSHKITAIATPCHTKESICYLLKDGHTDGAKKILFTGDTLFLAGCGRFFEGTAEQMDTALQTLAKLPSDTLVFPGHEYTLANLKFAASIEPDNANVQQRMNQVQSLKCSVPDTIGLERSTNPFMRVRELAHAFPQCNGDPVAIMAAMREAKNNFRA